MRPGPVLLLLGLGLSLSGGPGRRPPTPAPRGASATVPRVPGSPSGDLLGREPASARRAPPEARVRVPARTQAAVLRSVRGARGLGVRGVGGGGGGVGGGRARFSLRPRAAPGGGVILSGGRDLCLRTGRLTGPAPRCLRTHVLLRARRAAAAAAAAPAHVDLKLSAPGGRLSLRWLARLPRSLGRLEWTFRLGLLGPTVPTAAAAAARVSTRSAVSPLSALPRGPRSYAGLVARTKCPTDGPTPVVLEAVNPNTSQALESSVSRQGVCVLDLVRIERNDDSLLQLTRKMEVTINATVKAHCPNQRFFGQYWKLYSVASVSDKPDWTKPLQNPPFKSENTPSSIRISAHSLSWGVYLLNFSVYIVTYDPTIPPKKDSDSIYIIIVKSPLQAVIPGDTNITVNFTDGLTLNGNMSSDPDAGNPLEGLHFFWYCTTDPRNYDGHEITVRSKEVCLPEQVDLRWTWASGPILTLLPETLHGGRAYFFRLVVQKNDRTAFADRTVHVLQGPAPVANISCIENCDTVLIISERFSLSLECPRCKAGRDVYQWSILSSSGGKMPFDWTGQTTTGRNGAYLSVKAFAFRRFVEDKFWISLNLATWGGSSLVLQHPFVIHHVPETTECKIDPAEGIAFITKFVVHCSSFKDKNIVPTYKIIVPDVRGFGEISSLKENNFGSILYWGKNCTAPPSFLPVGVLANHYALKIYAQAYNTSLGAFSQVTLYATVQAPTDINSSRTVLQELFNSTVGPDSSLSTLLQQQEFLPAGYLMYIVASVLNSMKTDSNLQADQIGLREHLFNQSFILPVNTLAEISQVVMTVTKLTQKTSEFSSLAQKLATVRIWQASRALQDCHQRDKHISSEQIESVSTGILTSLSNILKLMVRHEVVEEPFHVVESLAETVLAVKVPEDKTTAMRTSNFNMYVKKTEKWNVTKFFSTEKHCRNCFYPTLNVSSVPSLPANAPISTMFCEFADDPFPWLNYGENILTEVVGFRMTGTEATGDVIEITPDVVEVYLVRKNLSFGTFNLTVGPNKESSKANESLRKTTGAFSFGVDSRAGKEVLIHIVTEVAVLFTVLVYAGRQITPTALIATYLVPHRIPPVAQDSDLFDPDCTVTEARVVCLPPSLLRVIAQRTSSSEPTVAVVLQAPHFVLKPNDKLVRISVFSTQCLDMYGIQSDWREDTCVVGEKTTWQKVHCICKNPGRARRQLDAMKLANLHLRTRYLTAKRRPQVTLGEVAPRKHPWTPAASEHWQERLAKWHTRETGNARSREPEKLPPTRRSPGLPEASVKTTSKRRPQPKRAESKVSRTQRKNKNANNPNVEDNQSVPPGEHPRQPGATPLKEKTRIVLPWCCVYVAWLLVFVTCSISSFFIVFYGLTYGYEKSIEWLFASFCCFLQSVFLVQPSKIMVVSGYRTSKPKYCENLLWVGNFRYSEIKLQSITQNPEEMRRRQQHVVQLRSSRMYQPLTEDDITIFKRKKRIKRRAFLFLSYILTHFMFLALLLSLVTLLRHTDGFYYNRFIRDQFSLDLASVTKLEDIFRWLNSVLLPLLHNDLRPTFLPESSSKILGLPRMRQVRAQPGEKTCLPAKHFTQDSLKREIHCHPEYGTDPEDTESYSGLWNRVSKRAVDKTTKGFTYKPGEKRWVYYSYGLLHTYGSGGYAFYFFPEEQQFNSTRRLSELQGSRWLDEKTWAVILELTTFNPDTTLFCSISVIFEVSRVGVVNASLSAHSFSLADFNRKTSAEIYLYVAILIFFFAYVVDEVYIITQERSAYVKSVYNLLNFALKCIFTVLIVLFFRKHFLAVSIIRFYLSNSEDFIPFHAVSQVDHAMRVMLGFLLFLTILKSLRYSRFFYNVRLAQRTIQTALPGICHMALVVSVYFFVYMTFGYLVFGQHEWNYSDMTHAMQTVLSYCVSAFQNTEFSSNRVLGVLFLSSFLLVTICILINLFQAVILSAYREMKQPVYEEPSEEAEAMTYLCHRLRTAFGFLSLKSKAEDQPKFFANMLYGQPEKRDSRYLGLKTRNINGKKTVYLVV
ncbi:polycystin family receptor for egg jelly [Orcinus orca]|uniref:polycystin family receptor for egg jelly n=1 Tax=Orcinus orca TaxID=9733 RepID=UPI0014424AC1|nr:polycystin family receptor for egg jelly [Orcinus orca]